MGGEPGSQVTRPGVFGSFEPHLHKTRKASSLFKIHPHLHHLKGAKRLEHVADDEEDVGDAQGAEEPVEEGRHRPEC